MTSFDTTQWSMILAGRDEPARAHAALDHLCRRYRPPVLAFLRHQGLTVDDAEDTAQAFFAHLADKRLHERVDPARGRFRSFLLGSLRHFIVSEHRREHASKRGGGTPHVSLADVAEPAADTTPEHAFEREWARTVLTHAVRQLRDEARSAGKEPLFTALQEFLYDPPEAQDYARVCAALGMSRNALAVAVHRMRQRLHELVRAEVERTVVEPDQVQNEIASLRDLWAARGA